MNSSLPLGLLPSRSQINWLPDETIYSLASRFHRLSGNSHARTTAKALFGHAHGGFPHDLPAGIRHLSDVFEGGLGSVEKIVNDHSVLPFLLTFRDEAQRREALAAVTGERIGSLKLRLGLPASRLGAVCLLKACPDCVEADTHIHGTPYWHRGHQLPGVWICLDHGSPLSVSTGKRAGEDRFGWTLPNNGDLQVILVKDQLSSESRNSMAGLARMIVDAMRVPQALEASRMSVTLLRRLRNWGLAGETGTLCAGRITASFRNAIGHLSDATDVRALSTSDGAMYGHVRHLIEAPASGHAFRHFLVLRWLFESWSEFLDHYEAANAPQSTSEEMAAPQFLDRRPEHREVLRLLAEMQLSISAAANQTGVAVSTAQAWATAAGITVHRRASKLAPAKLGRLVADLEAGVEIGAAASGVGVSVSSANRILRTHPGLIDRRQAVLFEQHQKRARHAWESANRSGMGATLAREIEPSAYAWLYRNDREWLLKTKGPSRLQRHGPRLDWDARDQQFCASIQSAALALGPTSNSRTITLISLLRVVPELKAKLDALEHLPRTAKLLGALIGRRIGEQGRLFEDGSASWRAPDRPIIGAEEV